MHRERASTYPVHRLDRGIALFVPASFEVALIELVVVTLGDAPEVASRAHGHVDDARRPDIDGPRIKFLVNVLFGRNVWGRAAEAGDEVRIGFPGHTETLAIAEIGNLESAVRREQQIFGLEIPMGDAHLVHVFNAAHHLFKVAIGFVDFELARSEDEGVEVTAGTEFHDLAVIAFGVLQEVESVDDVGMAQGGGDAEFRRQAFAILFLRLLGTTAKLLDGVELLAGALGALVGDADDAKGAAADNFLALAIFFNEGGGGVGLVGGREDLLFAAQLIDPAGHEGELLVAVVVLRGLLLATQDVSQHVGQLFLALGRLEIVLMATRQIRVDDEATGRDVEGRLLVLVLVAIGCIRHGFGIGGRGAATGRVDSGELLAGSRGPRRRSGVFGARGVAMGISGREHAGQAFRHGGLLDGAGSRGFNGGVGQRLGGEGGDGILRPQVGRGGLGRRL